MHAGREYCKMLCQPMDYTSSERFGEAVPTNLSSSSTNQAQFFSELFHGSQIWTILSSIKISHICVKYPLNRQYLYCSNQCTEHSAFYVRDLYTQTITLATLYTNLRHPTYISKRAISFNKKMQTILDIGLLHVSSRNVCTDVSIKTDLVLASQTLLTCVASIQAAIQVIQPVYIRNTAIVPHCIVLRCCAWQGAAFH